MEKKFLINLPVLITIFFIVFPILVEAPDLCSYRGYANKSGTLVNTTDVIGVSGGDKPYNATIFTDGTYTLDVSATPGANITFKICGVTVDQGYRNFTCPSTTLNSLNLSISSSANAASCSYSCACSGGYCCSGATEYKAGDGTGTCQSSACSAPSSGGSSGGGGGGGGGGATTTLVSSTTLPATTTSTTLPPKEETKSLDKIATDSSGTFTFTETLVSEIEVAVKNDVASPQVTVSQSSSKPTLVVSTPSNEVYGYVTVSINNLADTDISSAKIKFKVAKTWLSGQRVDESTIALSRFSGGTWNKLSTTKLSEDNTYVYFEALSPGLSYYSITGVQKTKPAFWDIINYIDKYYGGQLAFWDLLGHISDYYS